MLSDVPLMAYLGWNWIPFPNGLLIACFWFYRLLQLTHNSSDRHAYTCDLPTSTSARSPLDAGGSHNPQHLWGAQPGIGLDQIFSHPVACAGARSPLFTIFGGRSHVLSTDQLSACPRNMARLRRYFLISVRAGGQAKGGFPPVGCQQFPDAVAKSY